VRKALGLTAAVALGAGTLLAAGCGDDDDEGGDGGGAAAPAGIFVGTVEGTGAYIGIKSDGETVGGYLCNGKQGLADDEIFSVWIDETEVSDGEAELVARTGDAIGSVTVSKQGAEGEIDFEGESYAFSAEPASGKAGIYRDAEGELGQPGSFETGAVVLEDGSFRGAKRAVTQGGSSSIDPVTGQDRPTSSGYIDPGSNF
jgi:hypothetical protein